MQGMIEAPEGMNQETHIFSVAAKLTFHQNVSEDRLGIPGNKRTLPELRGNKGKSGNRDQVKPFLSLSIHLTIDLKKNPTKLQGTGRFSQRNREACNPQTPLDDPR